MKKKRWPLFCSIILGLIKGAAAYCFLDAVYSMYSIGYISIGVYGKFEWVMLIWISIVCIALQCLEYKYKKIEEEVFKEI